MIILCNGIQKKKIANIGHKNLVLDLNQSLGVWFEIIYVRNLNKLNSCVIDRT